MRQNIGVRYGLLAGVGSMFYLSCLYAIQKELYYNQWLGVVVTLLYLLAMIGAGLRYRREENPDAMFSDTLKVTFTVAVVAGLIVVIFQYMMPNMVDPSLFSFLKAYQLEDLKNLKAQQNDMAMIKQISSQIADLETNGVQFTFSNAIFAFARSLVSGFLFAAVAAYLTKKQ